MKGDERNPGEKRKSGFKQENAWIRRQTCEWAGNEKDVPVIHERIGAGKSPLVFSSMSFRKG